METNFLNVTFNLLTGTYFMQNGSQQTFIYKWEIKSPLHSHKRAP